MLPIREPQLATLVDTAPEGDDWFHEQKFDGYRILAERTGREVQLFTRRLNDWTASYPSVAAAVLRLPAKRLVLDGEVAVVAADGRTHFQALQGATSGEAAAPLTYFVFDLLESDAGVLTALPLAERKARLRELVGAGPPGDRTIVLSDHVIGRGGEFFRAACAAGLEGIVSKRRDRPYTPGRGATWVKTKCIRRQELVVGGWTEPDGGRSHFGALLVGYFDGARLVYAGKVGTGFTNASLAAVRASIDRVPATTSPFEPPPKRAWTGPGVHWVKPVLVAEVAFTEWTTDGRLRHPSFKGLRADKRARDVVRE
jgi:bifunctional non-homologous end joining protein LigD